MGPPSGSVFSVGGTKIRYNARDGQGNLSPDCTFFVIVEALTCQQNLQDDKLRYNCPDNNFNYGSTCELSCYGNYPLFGNSTITCEKNETMNSAEAVWWWGTNVEPYCQESTCPTIDPPQNGALTCNMAAAKKFCTFSCNADFDFPIGKYVGEMYVCSNSGNWFPEVPVPGCTALRNPIYMVLPGELYYFTGNCDDKATQNAIKQNFVQIFESENLSLVCPLTGCNITSVEVSCGKTGGKRRRSVQKRAISKCLNKIQFYGVRDTGHKRKRSIHTSHEIKLTFDIKMDYQNNGNNYFDFHDLMKEFQNATIEQAIAKGQLNIGNISVSGSTVGWTDFGCAEGQKFRFPTFSCASCPPGFFFNKTTENCVKCPIGEYQDEDGSVACKQCPLRTSTVYNGTRNSSLCLEICSKGSYSKTGLSPCFKCLHGEYQDQEKSTSCKKCPNFQTTVTTGTSKASDCGEFDTIIKDNSTTIDIGIPTQNLTIALWILTQNVYKEHTLQLFSSNSPNTIQFIFSNKTLFVINGVITDVSKVEKQNQWNHIAIQVNTNNGHLFVVLNGQTIFSNTTASMIGVTEIKLLVPDIQLSRYVAYPYLVPEADVLSLSKSCSANLSSSSIQTVDNLKTLPGAEMIVPSTCSAISVCEQNPCNGHTCLHVANGFECRCKDGYSGVTCNNPPDYCIDNKCKNDATCVGQNGTYSCVCSAGFKGTFCENVIVNGNWNIWQQWSGCSKSCNGGIRSRNRTCDNPPPDDEGFFCIGADRDIQPCNTEACPECPSFATVRSYGNLFTCNQVNGYDICNVTCRNGLVFPNGDYHLYHCGKNTSFEWPQKPPSCLDPSSPIYMALKASSTVSSFPCSGKEEAVNTYQSNINTLWCLRSGTCNLEITTEGCNSNTRKRRSISNLNINVTISLQLENQPLDFVALIDSGIESAAVKSFINAYNELETTAQEMRNMSSTIFAVNINGISYNIDGNTINMQPNITCAAGTVLQDVICAQCPQGTRYLNGMCVYCDKGTYQNLTGKTECNVCPYGYTTHFKGSRSISDCGVQESTTVVVTTVLTTTQHEQANGDSKKKGVKTGIIIGVLAVCLLGGAIIGFIIFKQLIRKRKMRTPSIASLGKIHPDIVVESCDKEMPKKRTKR